jgi:ribonuclease HII
MPKLFLKEKITLNRNQKEKKIFKVLKTKPKKSLVSYSLMYFERILWKEGIELVAGVDEVGMGALAGPVVASAVIFPKEVNFFKLKDSKKLTPRKRKELSEIIKKKALNIGIGKVSVKQINRINNIYNCGLEAMKKAVQALKVKPQHLLVDARRIPNVEFPQSRFANGESINFSIAAASIVAKVYRDNLMMRYSKAYPEYKFDQHKGYATSGHVEILKKRGPCEIHRTSYEFIKGICGGFGKEYFRFCDEIKKAQNDIDLSRLDAKLNKLKQKTDKVEWVRLRKKIAGKRRK